MGSKKKRSDSFEKIISNKFVSLGPEDKARHPQVWYLPRTASGPGQLQAEGKGKGHFAY